ncbi:hypothetical protein E8E13_000049 [Curvularia kusanoi]|uniref:Uncharacterized protein n=1 Tax=Curvularia kusanoi TaxID=90978 RepID=A0A9P4W3I6_CURKU|nr:hypothetical protein E8E13_000049 [Curvularia kusanoi]
MTTGFLNKVVLITGAGSGIGREAAIKFGFLGAKLALCDINESTLESLAGYTKGLMLTSVVDVGNTDQVNHFIERAVEYLGGIDFVFNCAGVNPTSTPIEATTDAYWDKLINTNLKGTFLVTRACIPHLSRGSAIVNVSSILGLRGAPQQSVYCASKFGLIGMTKALALELGPRGVRVNAVAPGNVDTPSNAERVEGGEVEERMRRGNALGHVGMPEDVVDVVVFLMSEGARYMNGSVVEVTGGMRW